MARKYLTPIDLTGLELQNAKIQNLATDPSAYGKGHVYFNTAHNELRVYDGTMWVAVGGSLEFGNTASRPAAGNAGRSYADTQTSTLYVDNGTSWVQIGVNSSDLSTAISNAALANTDALSEGSTNLYYLDSRARAAISGSGAISYDSTTGIISVDYTTLESQLVTDGFATASSTTEFSNKSFSDSITVGGAVYVGGTTNNGLDVDGSGNTELGSTTGIALSANNDITLTSSSGDIVLNPHGYAYLDSATSGNEVVSRSATETLSNKTLTNAALGSALDAGTYKITNLADPTSSQDAATKSYVDASAQGLSVLGSVRAASDATLNLAGTVSVVGGVTLADGDRVLVKSQTTATENGIYSFNGTTSKLVASTVPADIDIKEGSYALVEEGTYAAQGWIVTGFVAGASTWTQFSAAGEYTAGNGIDITDGAISAVVNTAAGMSLNSSGIAINAGSGLEFDVSTGALKVNGFSTLASKFSDYVGDGASTAVAVTHGLGTKDVQVSVYEVSSGDDVIVDITRTSDNVVTLGFAVAPTTNAYRVVVVA